MATQSGGLGTRLHNLLSNRNIVGQHTSEAVGVLSPYSINPSDIGLSWASVLVTSASVESSTYLGNGIVIVGAGFEIFRSTDYGFTWSNLGAISFGGSSINSLLYLGNGIVVFSDGNSHIFRSTDFGLTWTDLGAVAGAVPVASSYLGSRIALFGDVIGNIFRSTAIAPANAGLTWSSIAGNPIGTDIRTISYLDNDIVIFGDFNGHIFRSTNLGLTWTDLNISATPFVSSTYLSNGVVVAGQNNGHIWRSTDFGATWTDGGDIAGTASINTLLYLGDGILIAGDGNGAIHKSTDYGSTISINAAVIGASNFRRSSYLGNGIAILTDANATVFRSDISYKTDESIQKINTNIRTVTSSDSPVTLNRSDDVILANAVAGPITINLPSVTGAGIAGQVYSIVKIDTSENTATIDAAGTETINTALTQSLTVQYQSLSIKAKPSAPNAGWWIF
jgi:photosystem II stability/assembly factor-like uncharacterized protein